MAKVCITTVVVALLAAPLLAGAGPVPAGKTAPKPLYRDPVHDGAADPVLIWNRAEKKWFMFYTNRRADLADSSGVAWVHGTRIGIAESSDGGTTWQYRGTAKIDYGKADYTYWAPDVFEADGAYHMFLSVVPGIFSNWDAPRDIVHLTSGDLVNWKFVSKLDLESDRVIDATVLHLPNGKWRLWYKNERSKTPLWYADSDDLASWKVRGPAITDRPGEGPKVFRWKGRCWLVADMWHGLGVYSSDDCEHWNKQEKNLLETPGKLPTDRAEGHHPDVVVSGGRAYIFYFVHQTGADAENHGPTYRRHTVIQVAELEDKDGRLDADRDKPAQVDLVPPKIGESNR